MGQALYRKYRSKSLDEIVGQSHITSLLARAIASGNIAHAYLLTGPRGVGKTSIARILAHEINGLPYTDESTHLDIIEIDAASNNSVEDIRSLREKVMIAPAQANKKVYIIDEVHMLSKSAFNALLKTLEEPPEHAVFILATTDVEKLPATIISRVQRFNFRTIGISDAVRHLRTIASAESIDISDDALELVARHGRGSFRDSISLLDQLRSLTDGTITTELVENILGLADKTMVEALLAAYDQQDIATITRLINDAESRGTPATVLAEQLIQAIRGEISEKPQLLPLLDALLDINRSAWPHVKLLVALAGGVEDRLQVIDYGMNKLGSGEVRKLESSDNAADESNLFSEGLTPSSALLETRPEEKTVANKRHGSGEDSDKRVTARGAAPASGKISDFAEDGADALAGPVSSDLRGEDALASAADDRSGDSKQSGGNNTQPFPWSDFSAQLKPGFPGVYTLLAKCGHTFDGHTLTIYAGKPFAKKQLDKVLTQLAAALEAVGVADGTIEVLPSALPTKNSQAAAILDIMGGGEEVSL